IRHHSECVGNLVSAQTDLQELTWYERAVPFTSNSNIGIPVVEQGTGPVIVPPLWTIITGKHFPENGTRFGIQCIPIGITTSNIEHTILYGSRRSNACFRRIADRVRLGDTEERFPF